MGALFALAILANVFVAYFVHREHYIYFWDFSGYGFQLVDTSTLLLEHPVAALRSVIWSARHSDYSALAILPLVPFEWLFGSSRLSYILAITNVFVLPSVFLIALLAQRINSTEWSVTSFILVVSTTLSLPSLWIPVLQGYPEAVGLVVISIILLLHFGKPFIKQEWPYLLLTGFLLFLLIVLRRWYAYWVVAFFPALAVAQCLDLYQRHGLVWRPYVTAAGKAISIGLTFAIAFFGLATPLAWKAITIDYSDIYSAYRSSDSLLNSAVNLISFFGWPVFFGGLVGLVWLAKRKETRPIVAFLVIQSLIAFVLFARTQDWLHHHYLVLPAIALGLSVVVMNIATKITSGLWRATALGILFGGLLAGFITVFIPEAAPISNVLAGVVPGFRWYPLVRDDDFKVLDSLLDRLSKLRSQQAGDIYVLASSGVLNDDIMRNYCSRLGPRPRSFCDRIIGVNHVDKRDGFPQQFLDALYVVVADPIQYHLRPDDQRVIGILAREVMEEHGIGRSYQRLPGEFSLSKGVTAWVYSKIHPFERSDLDALAAEFGLYYPDRRNRFIIPTQK